MLNICIFKCFHFTQTMDYLSNHLEYIILCTARVGICISQQLHKNMDEPFIQDVLSKCEQMKIQRQLERRRREQLKIFQLGIKIKSF